MVAAILALALLSAAIVCAVLIISHQGKSRDRAGIEGVVPPLLQASGVYSIVRSSPREELRRIRPGDDEIRKYLSAINEDINMQLLSSTDKQRLVEHWQASMEENIRTIEQGDATGEVFYYLLDLSSSRCGVCAAHFKKRQIITREEIFKNPSIIPPFHLGCTTRIIPFQERDSGDSAILDTGLLFSKSDPPAIPDWKTTVRISEN